MHKNIDFFYEYSKMYRPFTNQLNRILDKHGLSSSYWRVMRTLDTGDSKIFGDITDKLYIEKPALTKIIKKLCEMEIVEIQRGHDKREKIVQLTELGKEKIISIRSELDPFYDSALQGLSQEQIDSAIEVLQIVRKNIKEY